jgi:heme exporter protein A
MLLRADNIALDRGGRRLFSNLSFVLGSGEALVLRGRNGAGKTSLLRAIAELLPLAAGALTLDGGEADLPLGEQAHYLGHADALKGALTAGENLEFWAAMLAPESRFVDAAVGRVSRAPRARLSLGARSSVAAALDQVGLAHAIDFPVHALSAGQKRRVALARLILAPRRLWLLDEPLTALDHAAQRRLMEILDAHLAAGGLIVAATHAPLDLSIQRELRLDEARQAA